MSFDLVLNLVLLYTACVAILCVVKYRSQGSLTLAGSLLASAAGVALFVLALVSIG